VAVAVPQAGFAVIGGTGSQAASFLAESQGAVRVLEERVVVDTPYGESPPFTLFELDGRRVLHVRLHGWRRGVPRGVASRQVFSVLQRAGVRRILGDAGVGSLNHLLDPGDLVIPDDFVDVTSQRAGQGVGGGGAGPGPPPPPRPPPLYPRRLRRH
jgi:5'-methylthioadenosine phosphorylase